MNLNNHKIGDRLLFSIEHAPRDMREGIFQEVSPSRIYVRLGYQWFLSSQVTVAEVLPPHTGPNVLLDEMPVKIPSTPRPLPAT